MILKKHMYILIKQKAFTLIVIKNRIMWDNSKHTRNKRDKAGKWKCEQRKRK